MANLEKKREVNIQRVNICIKTIDELKNFVSLTSKLKSNTEAVSGPFVVDAKSIMGMLSLNLSHSVSLTIYSVDDEETENFLDDIKHLIVEPTEEPENNETVS